MQPSIPQDISLALPIFAAMLSNYLQSDHLAAWKNAAMAAFFILATAVACIWLSGTSFVPGNPQASILLVIAYISFLMRGPLAVLSSFFASVRSPFDATPVPANSQPVTGVGTRATVPTPIQIPPASSGK